MHYPQIDPVIVSFGPIAIRWYGLAYLAGFLAAWWLGNRRAARANWTPQQVSDLVFYCAIGAVIGGRIGYVFFYGFSEFLADPLWLFRIWDGGMSFHGGLIGAVVAMAWFGRATHRTFLQVDCGYDQHSISFITLQNSPISSTPGPRLRAPRQLREHRIARPDHRLAAGHHLSMPCGA